MGTGPFRFVEWVGGERTTLARNAEYWDRGQVRLRARAGAGREDGVGLGRGQAPRRARHHEGAHPGRRAERVAETRPAAHRLGDQPHVGEAQVVDQRGQVFHEGRRSRPTGRLAGWAEAPVGEDDARVALAEVRDLLPPGEVAPAQPVGEDEGWSRTVGLVVELARRTGEKRHVADPQGARPT